MSERIVDGQPSVDVVIPVYGERPEAIEATLDALLAQEHPVSNIFVVDDGSPVPAALPARLQSESRIHLIRLDKNAGVSAARNAGIAKCTAPLVVCVDSEVLLARNWVFACAAFFASHEKAGITYTRILPERPDRLLTRWRMRFQETRFPEVSGETPFAPGHGLMFRREALVRVGGFTVGMRCDEDSDICFRIGRAGWQTHFVAESECLSIQRDTLAELASKDLTRSNWESPADYPLPRFIWIRTKMAFVRMGRNFVKLRLSFLPVDVAVWGASIRMAISRSATARPKKN